MYDWRKLTATERRDLLLGRKAAGHPWHSPPHRIEPGTHQFILSAACFEHASIIGNSPERMDKFSESLLAAVRPACDEVFAWCVLPNHYHLVVQTSAVATLLRILGQVHGRTSFQWNAEEQRRGRQVWFSASDRELRSERHLWASVNYLHNNSVKHGYVERWQDWPWSSAISFLEEMGPERSKAIWLSYPVRDYGKGWDD